MDGLVYSLKSEVWESEVVLSIRLPQSDDVNFHFDFHIPQHSLAITITIYLW